MAKYIKVLESPEGKYNGNIYEGTAGVKEGIEELANVDRSTIAGNAQANEEGKDKFYKRVWKLVYVSEQEYNDYLNSAVEEPEVNSSSTTEEPNNTITDDMINLLVKCKDVEEFMNVRTDFELQPFSLQDSNGVISIEKVFYTDIPFGKECHYKVLRNPDAEDVFYFRVPEDYSPVQMAFDSVLEFSNNIFDTVLVIYTPEKLWLGQMFENPENLDIQCTLFSCNNNKENEKKVADVLAKNSDIREVILLSYVEMDGESGFQFIQPSHLEYVSIFNTVTDELVDTFPSIVKACKKLKLNYRNCKDAIKDSLCNEGTKFGYTWRYTEANGDY